MLRLWLKLTRERPLQNGLLNSLIPIRIKPWFYFRNGLFRDPAGLKSIASLTCCSRLTLPRTDVSSSILFQPSISNLGSGAAFRSSLSAQIARTRSLQLWHLEISAFNRIQGRGLSTGGFSSLL